MQNGSIANLSCLVLYRLKVTKSRFFPIIFVFQFLGQFLLFLFDLKFEIVIDFEIFKNGLWYWLFDYMSLFF